MVWFFDRAGGVAPLQTTFDNDAQEFMLVIEAPGEPFAPNGSPRASPTKRD